MRVLRLDGDDFLLDLEPEALPAVLRHLSMYKVGREVEVEDASRDSRAPVGDRPRRSARLTGAAAARSPREPTPRRSSDGVACRAIATDVGLDLLCDADAAEPLAAALAAAGVAEVSPEAAEIVRVESGPPALRARDDDGDDPAGGGHQRAGRLVHQGLLHRPGDRRPPPLQGQAEPPPARAALRAGARRRATRSARARRSWARSGPRSSPPPSARSRWRSCAARPSRAPRVDVGDGAVARGRRAAVRGRVTVERRRTAADRPSRVAPRMGAWEDFRSVPEPHGARSLCCARGGAARGRGLRRR